MIDRQQVNLRLERDLLEQLDELARDERLDRTELVRRILAEGIARQRAERVVDSYSAGHVTAWRAAELAGISLYDMLDRIHERGVVHEVDPAELAAIRRRTDEMLSGCTPDVVSRRAVAEDQPPYGSDEASGVDELRAMYRPRVVRTLFVGESSPAGGTHFYRANSNLFRAVREAFAAAYAPEPMPDGGAFLAFFAGAGNWLVDLADAPVNRTDHGPRRLAVQAGVARLQATISDTRPERIVAIKSTVGYAVRQAAASAGSAASLKVLPFPVRQWRATFVSALTAILRGRGVRPSEGGADEAAVESTGDVGAAETQRITRADLGRGQIRIPITGRAKSLFPASRGKMRIVVRGREFSAGYDPHHDPDQERSGVLRIGSALASMVEPDERLKIARAPDGSVVLD